MSAKRRSNRLRAVAGVWMAMMIFTIVAMLGYAMDTSYVVYVGQQLQVAADAASLAGAQVVKGNVDLARTRAQATGQANTAGVTAGVPDPVLLDLNIANLPNGDIVTGRYYRWDDDTTDPPRSAGDFDPTAMGDEINAVMAVARRTDSSLNGQLPLLFGPVFGVDTTNVTRDAIAMVHGSTGAGLIVLCPDCECALKFGGNTYLTLTTAPGYNGDASIIVDSNATGCSPNRAAVCGSGSSLNIDAPEINIVAEGPESSCWSGDPIVPPLNPGSPYVPDPLAHLPEPDYLLMPDYGCISDNGCYSAQICSGGLDQGDLCAADSDCSDDQGTCAPTGSACGGGPSSGNACTADLECEVAVSCDPVLLTCTGGPGNGAACEIDTDCGNWICDDVYNCISGLVGSPCTDPLGNECDDVGICIGGRAACDGGDDDGLACTSNADCFGGTCREAPWRCNEGDNHNWVCTTNADCPGGGECLETEWARPGYYSGGFRLLSSNFRIILDSGVYSLDNADGGPDAGLYVNGGHFDARAGVMLHVVNDGIVQVGGSGNIYISPIPTPGHLYEGVSIFQSRTNYQLATIIGTTSMNLLGTYYFPHNPVKISGVGISVGNQLIAWTIFLSGTGTYTIAYNGSNPAPGYEVFLVD